MNPYGIRIFGTGFISTADVGAKTGIISLFHQLRTPVLVYHRHIIMVSSGFVYVPEKKSKNV